MIKNTLHYLSMKSNTNLDSLLLQFEQQQAVDESIIICPCCFNGISGNVLEEISNQIYKIGNYTLVSNDSQWCIYTINMYMYTIEFVEM